MKKFAFWLLMWSGSVPLFASNTPLWFKSVSQNLSAMVFSKVTMMGVSFPWIVALLTLAGVFFTCYFNFINFRGLNKAMKIVTGHDNSLRQKGEVSHFQALATAISGTVGIGNIGGVAVALSLGGPGATFWIIIGGLLGMSTKFIECTLGVMFRNIHHDGSVSGGPMVYLQQGLKKSPLATLGTLLGVIYALLMVCSSVGAGNMFQANQAFTQLVIATGGPSSWLADKPYWVGLVFATSVGFVIIGGIRSIVKLTEKIVPFMAIFYLIAATSVLAMHSSVLPHAMLLIVTLAFTPSAIKGGVVGVLMIGMQRAFFSNEAGLGTAAIAHSAVKTGEPLSQGFVSLLEPLIDTVFICTITGLVITTVALDYPTLLSTQGNIQGVALTSKAFSTKIPGFANFLAFAVVLFAYSTMISWSYYGLKAWTFLVGRSRIKEIIYQFLYCCFIVVGTASSLTDVINFSDACIFLLAIPNVLGCIMLAPKVKSRLKEYMAVNG